MTKADLSKSSKGALARDANGRRFAGTHLFLDMWDVVPDYTVSDVEQAIDQAIAASGATLMTMNAAEFGSSGGVTVFAILAESHICVNTWAEERQVAVDVFFCAGLDPYSCLQPLRDLFKPQRESLSAHQRLLETL